MTHTYTSEQAHDLIKCRDNAVHFARKFRKDLSPDQYYWLMSDDFVIHMKNERATFRTSTMLLRILHTAAFKYSTSLYIAHSHACTMSARDQFQDLIDSLEDKWILPGIERKDRHGIRFDTGATVHFRTASDCVGRGMTLQTVAMDNVSMVRKETHEYMLECVLPTLYKGTLLVAD